MLPVSGQITMNMIKAELGFAESVNLHLKVRLFNGVKQIYVNNDWFNLNMCSPNLPPHGGQLRIKDFYGYNHAAVCCTPPSNVRLYAYDPNSSPLGSSVELPPSGSQVNFYVKWDGSQNNVEIIWEHSWFLGLTPQSTPDFVKADISDDPAFNSAFIKVTVKSLCGEASKTVEVTVPGVTIGPCTSPTSVLVKNNNSTANIQIAADTNVQLTFDVSFNGTGSGTVGLNATYTWQYWGEVTFNGQNTLSSQATFNLPPNASGWVRCIVSNPCGTVISNVINIIAGSGGVTQFGNQPQTATVVKVCPSGQVGSTHTKTVEANTYYADTLGDANVLAYNDALAQAIAERDSSIGTCTPVGTCPLVINSVSVSSPQAVNGVVTVDESVTSITLVVTINATGSGSVIISDPVWNFAVSRSIVNGNNVFEFTTDEARSPQGFWGLGSWLTDLKVFINNSEYCSIRTVNSSNAITVIFDYGVVDPSVWTNIGAPYCVGLDLKQDQKDQYNNTRTITAEANSSSCVISNPVDFSKIEVSFLNKVISGTTRLIIHNQQGSNGTINLYYRVAFTNVNSPTSTVPEGTQTTSNVSLLNTGTYIYVRLWFSPNDLNYEDRLLRVLDRE